MCNENIRLHGLIQGPVFEKTCELQYFSGEALYGFAVFGGEATSQSSSEGLGTTNRTSLRHEVVHLNL